MGRTERERERDLEWNQRLKGGCGSVGLFGAPGDREEPWEERVVTVQRHFACTKSRPGSAQVILPPEAKEKMASPLFYTVDQLDMLAQTSMDASSKSTPHTFSRCWTSCVAHKGLSSKRKKERETQRAEQEKRGFRLRRLTRSS